MKPRLGAGETGKQPKLGRSGELLKQVYVRPKRKGKRK